MATTPRGARTQKNILEAAFQHFLQQGYHGTSMRQVARAAGVSPAAIYNHFESKEALFSAVLTARMPHRALVDALAAARGENVEALVHDALERMQASMADQFDNFRLLFIELIEFQGEHAAQIISELSPGFLSFIQRMKRAEGRLRPFSDSILARSFVGLFISYALTSAMLPQLLPSTSTPRDLEALGDLYLHGVIETTHGAQDDR